MKFDHCPKCGEKTIYYGHGQVHCPECDETFTHKIESDGKGNERHALRDGGEVIMLETSTISTASG